jgi:hypothetical protein
MFGVCVCMCIFLCLCTGSKLQCDSKLLSGFPWPIIFKRGGGGDKIKLLTEYESVTEKSFVWQHCPAIKFYELHFHISSAVLFFCFRLEY